MIGYTLGIGMASASPQHEPVAVTAIEVALRLCGPCEARVSWIADLSSSSSPDTAAYAALAAAPAATDLWVWRQGTLIFRGRCVALDETIEANGIATINSQWADYRALLDRRFTGPEMRFPTGTGNTAIPWALINEVQSYPGGNMGITLGSVASATYALPAPVIYPAGQSVGEAITSLSAVASGFEWAVGPDRVFRVWTTRGAHNGVILALGENVQGPMRRAWSSQDFATHVFAQGGQGTSPQTYTDPGIATNPAGRWDARIGHTEVLDNTTLLAMAQGAVSTGPAARMIPALLLAHEWWQGPSHVQVGDVVTIAAPLGFTLPGLPMGSARVWEIGVSVDPSTGLETVQVAVQ